MKTIFCESYENLVSYYTIYIIQLANLDKISAFSQLPILCLNLFYYLNNM